MRRKRNSCLAEISARQEFITDSDSRKDYDFFRNVSYTPYARIPPIMT